MADDYLSHDLPDPQSTVERFYTPAMLAELLGVPVTVVRRWHRHGLIVPVQEVRRLVYFDFQEVAVAQRLAQLFWAGLSPQHIEKKVADLDRLLPGVQRPILQGNVIVQGQSLLVRQGDGLVEAGGQLRWISRVAQKLEYRLQPESRHSRLKAVLRAPHPAAVGVLRSVEDVAVSPEQMRSLAAELEDAGRLSEAANVYRVAMAAAGPNPESCFRLPNCFIAKAN